MRHRITITAGIEESAEGAALDRFTSATAIAHVRRLLAAECGGYTETDTNGGWVNDEGRLVEERGKRWDLSLIHI